MTSEMCERENCTEPVTRRKLPPAYPRFHAAYERVCALGHVQRGGQS